MLFVRTKENVYRLGVPVVGFTTVRTSVPLIVPEVKLVMRDKLDARSVTAPELVLRLSQVSMAKVEGS